MGGPNRCRREPGRKGGIGRAEANRHTNFEGGDQEQEGLAVCVVLERENTLGRAANFEQATGVLMHPRGDEGSIERTPKRTVAYPDRGWCGSVVHGAAETSARGCR